VKHVVKALIKLAQSPAARGVVNVCSGRATALRKLVDILIDVSGKKITIQTSSTRIRSEEPAVVVGSTVRLTRLGAAPPPTDFEDVMTRVWREAELHWAGSS
jgi:nucleoside-diphosphate-sugar epimerase